MVDENSENVTFTSKLFTSIVRGRRRGVLSVEEAGEDGVDGWGTIKWRG